MKRLVFGLLGLALLSAAFAEELVLKDTHPDHYTVKKGDTLWDISNVFLENPWMWPEIWQVNPQIENPHLIYPGDQLSLVYVEAEAAPPSEGSAAAEPKKAPRLVLKRGLRTVKLSPETRIEATPEAIPAIPLDKISQFLSESRVVSAGELEQAPYVLAGAEMRLVTGAGDTVYARGDFTDGNKIYGVYRPDGVYVDPASGEVLGYAALNIGSVKRRAQEGDVATLSVTRTTQEIRVEDRLLPHEERDIDSMFYPSAPEQDVNGQIIAVEGGVSQIGSMNVVAVNRGLRDGVKVGHILAIYRRGGAVKDRVKGGVVHLPDERAGLLMVFRAYEKMSFGLVLDAERRMSVGDKVKNP